MSEPIGTGTLADAILACVASIPSGSVLSYSDVAEYVGHRSPRTVGRVLALEGGSVPWHRVLRADGSMADHIADEQTQRLRGEGVPVFHGRVDMIAYRWDGRSTHARAPRAGSVAGPC